MPSFNVNTSDLGLLNPFTLNGSIGASANVNADVGIKSPLPKITLGVDPITLGLDPVHVVVDPLSVGIGITELPPIRIAITELPLLDFRFGLRPMRFHFPVNLKLAICLLGKEVLSIGTCGESMVVVEDYVAHHTERCA